MNLASGPVLALFPGEAKLNVIRIPWSVAGRSLFLSALSWMAVWNGLLGCEIRTRFCRVCNNRLLAASDAR